ncbi:MFS transporter [Streptosporangiaceae bacterium NEAU-GS5]|nr:MFS transporter [Streptosporangiaceae bacterium NEAU-GS5]
METYAALFRTKEFTPLFVTASAQVAASTVSGLALGSLVYAGTGSPLLAAVSLFGASFAQAVGAATVLSAADRVPPRAAITLLAVLFMAGTAVSAAPGLPVWSLLAIQLVLGLASSAGGGIRWGLLTEILPADAYILGRSVFQMAVGAMQIGGFAVGGAIVAALSPRTALLAGAGLYLVAALAARFGLTARPPRSTGRASIRETLRVNAALLSSPARRAVYLALWVPNGLVVGCEALFIPYAPDSAGVLFIAAALGMLAGDATMGRWTPRRWRNRLITPLRLLLAVPYLIFALPLPLPAAVAAIALASAGYAAGLLLQDRLVALTPDEMRGQALGLHSSGMLTMQAVGATLAGSVAQLTGAGTAMTVMAVASVAVTLALTPALRPRTSPPEAAADPTDRTPTTRARS